tara:strand:- start:687 stop:869 length:183 start_codon:yes stop_codon:yes gene_type:complete
MRFEKQTYLKENFKLLDWYDKAIFTIVCLDGKSMLKLSKDTGISYGSIRKTIKEVKNKLK